jgi:hypothetical protein
VVDNLAKLRQAFHFKEVLQRIVMLRFRHHLSVCMVCVCVCVFVSLGKTKS